MKATEIVEKLKNVLLSSEEVKEIEVQEEEVKVEASSEEVEELAEEPGSPEEVIEEEKEELGYATKEELAEVRAMVEKLMSYKEEDMSVPEELSSQEVETEPMTHSPENVSEKVQTHLYSQQAPQTRLDRIFNRLNNNN